jgi:hypothetical protein
MYRALICFSFASISNAAIVTVSFESGGQTILNQTGALLSGGTTADGDGAVIQLGYFSGATVGNNFAGTWIPLTGDGSANTGGAISGTNPLLSFNKTSIGDPNSSEGNGTFALTVNFDTANPGTNNNLPSSTSIPLALRFYNNSTVASSTFYNTVSNDLWLWRTPVDPPNFVNVFVTLADTGLEWQSIAEGGAAGTAFRTSIPIPEPSTALLAGLGLLGLATRRRRS